MQEVEILSLQSLLMMVDSYKVSHWLQFPEGMSRSFYYVESRGGKFDETAMDGVRNLTNILARGVTKEEVEFAREFFNLHFGQDIFPYDLFMKIVNEREGKLPLIIRAIPEGVVVPVKTPLVTVETEEGYGALAGYFETLILRAIWYPTTVSTISFEAKKTIFEAMKRTSTLTGIDGHIVSHTRLHDFGARGVSSGESAGIGGGSHLKHFIGSDTVEGILHIRRLFGTEMAGISIPAREHSTTTCYLREGEYEAFTNSLDNFGGGYFAVVIDSYSTKEALEWLTTNEEFSRKLKEKGGVCVLRPDSGLPIEMVMLCLDTVAKNVGFTVNENAYKVLDPLLRAIQGDGVHVDDIKRITAWITSESNRYSQENLAYGMGGGLLQQCDRDSQRFAMKCSAMEVDGKWRGVYKSPETDPSKKSKEGRLDTVKRDDGSVGCVVLGYDQPPHERSIMKEVFKNGEELTLQTLEDIREISDNYCK